MATSVRDELDVVLSRLPEDNLKALLEVLRGSDPKRRIRRWSRAVGALEDAPADEMRRAIEEDCEAIEPDAW